MSYKDEFQRAAGWSAIDLNIRLDNKHSQFLDFLTKNNVSTIIRYYATDASNPKTLTVKEAKFLSLQGFNLLPVFQNSSREITDFSTASGKKNAQSALTFASTIGQPANAGSTIIFAVDADYQAPAIDGPILDYFMAIQQTVNSAFSIGAYGSGAVLSKLLAENLISVPWLSMSRGFLGTESFFYSNKWALRQLPPEQEFPSPKVDYDRNILRLSPQQLGAFTVDEAGEGHVENKVVIVRSEPVLFSLSTASTNRIITTEGVRLRTEPNGTIIRDLTIGEAVEDLGASPVAGWQKVQVGNESGVVFGKYLREPAGKQIEALLQAAIAEWLRFDKGKGNEKNGPYYRYIRDMWAAIGEPWDGKNDVPWSAAFISWVVRQAGKAYEDFNFAANHSVFVNSAIKARFTQQLNKPFWGYAINEEKPALGDIIQINRSGNLFSFSYAENHADYISHSDIVVEVTADVVRVMGGNVANTVSYGSESQEYELNEDGFIKPGQGVISLLKNRADKV